MAIEKKKFIGGLNSDIEDRLLPQGDYRYALNIRGSMSDGANIGAIENTKGNTLVDVVLPSGTNRVIGAYDNTETNKVYYFLFNSFRSHVIYEYSATSNTIVQVLRTGFLKFTSRGFINDPYMVGDLLFFNDRFEQPKRVNVQLAKNNGYPQPLKEEHILQIVPAPGFSPEVAYESDLSTNTNYVRNKLYQFRYKYVYYDNEESAWSPISKVPLPEGEQIYKPFAYYPPNLNNFIRVKIELGDSFVKGVKICAREGNLGDFYLIADLEKSKLGQSGLYPDAGYKFYNDEVATALDNDGNSGMRLYDRVPLLADSQSYIDGNRAALGGITEGYDPVDIDIDIFQNQPEVTQSVAPVVAAPYQYDDPGASYQNLGWQWYRTYIIGPYGANVDFYNSINGRSYQLMYLVYLWGRVGASNVFGANNYDILNGGYSYGGGARDRGFRLTIPDGHVINTANSLFTEVMISDPLAADVRYTLHVRLRYYDLGYSDTLITKDIKIQYTSIATDNQYDVANALKAKLDISGFTAGFVHVKFNNSLVHSYRKSNGNLYPQGQVGLRIWTEGNVLPADVVPGQRTGFIAPWPTEAGDHVGALYSSHVNVRAYGGGTLANNKSLKSGARHGLAMVYYDLQNRSGLSNVKTQEKTFYVEHFSERGIDPGKIPAPTTLSVTINHEPPSWATHYQFLYTGNQTVENVPSVDGYRGFVQFKLKNVQTNVIQGAMQADTSNITAFNNNVPDDIDLGYGYTKGDRLRFITEPINSSVIPFNYLTQFVDVEVISCSQTGFLVFKDPAPFIPLNDMLIEIYTPKKKAEELLYHEIGEVFPIVNGYHGSGQVNQTSSNPAVVDLDDIGDVYLRYRVSPMFALVEDYSYSDYYSSSSWDKGRPNKVDNNIKRVKRESTIVYSQPFIPETNINGLSQFNDGAFETYDQNYGSIQRMFSKGKTLTVYQNRKVGRLGVNQSTLYDNTGTPVGSVGQQSKVLNDISYYTEEFGIGVNPESFAFFGNKQYFVDVANGSVLRLGGDGITNISDLYMHNYFNDSFEKLINVGAKYRVFGEYDTRFGEYIISINEGVSLIELEVPLVADPVGVPNSEFRFAATPREPSNSPVVGELGLELVEDPIIVVPVEEEEVAVSDNPIYDTIAFSESKKRWVTYYSYVPDYMISNNVGLISFSNGELYKHNSNDTYNNFYGVQYNTVLRFLANMSPNVTKLFNSMFLESTHKFSMPQAINQFGQKTSLITDDFDNDEGTFKAALLKDENTPNVTLPLIEGDEIRCHSLDITLENEDTELVKLFEVGINETESKLTNK